MTPALAAQLVVSFAVGGVFIAIQSLIAERVQPAVAGIILTLPSTLGLSFFFIGWTLGPERVAEVAPLVPLTLGVSLLFTLIYIVTALQIRNTGLSMAVSTVVGIGFWFVLAAPLAMMKFKDPALSIGGFLAIMLLVYVILQRMAAHSPTVKHRYTWSDILVRSCFAGTLLATVVLLSKTLGVFWGGMFSAFPAANLSSILILHRSHGAASLSGISRTMPIGFGSLLIFVITASFAFPQFGTIGGTALSYLTSGAFSASVGAYFRARALASSRQHAASSSREHR